MAINVPKDGPKSFGSGLTCSFPILTVKSNQSFRIYQSFRTEMRCLTPPTPHSPHHMYFRIAMMGPITSVKY